MPIDREKMLIARQLEQLGVARRIGDLRALNGASVEFENLAGLDATARKISATLQPETWRANLARMIEQV